MPRGSGRRGSVRRLLPRASAARRGSLPGCAQDDAGIEIGLAAHEPAGYLRLCAAFDDKVEALAWRVRDGHQHRLRTRRIQDPLDLVRAAEDGDALQSPPT